jgi:uncharacterized protein (DUF2235 family)
MRKLVVCCDGTWNTPRTETNVFRTYDFLRTGLGRPPERPRRDGVRTCAGRARDGSEVVLFYDKGVGTNWYERLSGGAGGIGLSENVRDAYHFLAHAVIPGSEIYVFGFSRGAYTARSLCGFVRAAGLLRQPSEAEVWRAYMAHYVARQRVAARPRGWSLDQARERVRRVAGELIDRLGGPAVDDLPRHEPVRIRFIGVYDTVGALGVPLPVAADINEPIVGFHDTALGDGIEHAVHALAADERRGPYTPTLWTEDPERPLAAGQSVLQVWFPGVHSDVGGGYRDKGIGDITLEFMLGQAARRGLVVDPDHPTPATALRVLPPQHESFDRKWTALCDRLHLLPAGVRTIGTTVPGPEGSPSTVLGEARLHPSLVHRLGQPCVTILDEDRGLQREGEYRPPNVTASSLPLFA